MKLNKLIQAFDGDDLVAQATAVVGRYSNYNFFDLSRPETKQAYDQMNGELNQLHPGLTYTPEAPTTQERLDTLYSDGRAYRSVDQYKQMVTFQKQIDNTRNSQEGIVNEGIDMIKDVGSAVGGLVGMVYHGLKGAVDLAEGQPQALLQLASGNTDAFKKTEATSAIGLTQGLVDLAHMGEGIADISDRAFYSVLNDDKDYWNARWTHYKDNIDVANNMQKLQDYAGLDEGQRQQVTNIASAVQTAALLVGPEAAAGAVAKGAGAVARVAGKTSVGQLLAERGATMADRLGIPSLDPMAPGTMQAIGDASWVTKMAAQPEIIGANRASANLLRLQTARAGLDAAVKAGKMSLQEAADASMILDPQIAGASTLRDIAMKGLNDKVGSITTGGRISFEDAYRGTSLEWAGKIIDQASTKVAPAAQTIQPALEAISRFGTTAKASTVDFLGKFGVGSDTVNSAITGALIGGTISGINGGSVWKGAVEGGLGVGVLSRFAKGASAIEATQKSLRDDTAELTGHNNFISTSQASLDPLLQKLGIKTANPSMQTGAELADANSTFRDLTTTAKEQERDIAGLQAKYESRKATNQGAMEDALPGKDLDDVAEQIKKATAEAKITKQQLAEATTAREQALDHHQAATLSEGIAARQQLSRVVQDRIKSSQDYLTMHANKMIVPALARGVSKSFKLAGTVLGTTGRLIGIPGAGTVLKAAGAGGLAYMGLEHLDRYPDYNNHDAFIAGAVGGALGSMALTKASASTWANLYRGKAFEIKSGDGILARADKPQQLGAPRQPAGLLNQGRVFEQGPPTSPPAPQLGNGPQIKGLLGEGPRRVFEQNPPGGQKTYYQPAPAEQKLLGQGQALVARNQVWEVAPYQLEPHQIVFRLNGTTDIADKGTVHPNFDADTHGLGQQWAVGETTDKRMVPVNRFVDHGEFQKLPGDHIIYHDPTTGTTVFTSAPISTPVDSPLQLLGTKEHVQEQGGIRQALQNPQTRLQLTDAPDSFYADSLAELVGRDVPDKPATDGLPNLLRDFKPFAPENDAQTAFRMKSVARGDATETAFAIKEAKMGGEQTINHLWTEIKSRWWNADGSRRASTKISTLEPLITEVLANPKTSLGVIEDILDRTKDSPALRKYARGAMFRRLREELGQNFGVARLKSGNPIAYPVVGIGSGFDSKTSKTAMSALIQHELTVSPEKRTTGVIDGYISTRNLTSAQNAFNFLRKNFLTK